MKHKDAHSWTLCTHNKKEHPFALQRVVSLAPTAQQQYQKGQMHTGSS
jgi:hypothetical protein